MTTMLIQESNLHISYTRKPVLLAKSVFQKTDLIVYCDCGELRTGPATYRGSSEIWAKGGLLLFSKYNRSRIFL